MLAESYEIPDYLAPSDGTFSVQNSFSRDSGLVSRQTSGKTISENQTISENGYVQPNFE